MKEKISKLVNVYKKYGFIGFCKKLRAYIIANYLDKISFKTIFNKKKYTKEISKLRFVKNRLIKAYPNIYNSNPKELDTIYNISKKVKQKKKASKKAKKKARKRSSK